MRIPSRPEQRIGFWRCWRRDVKQTLCFGEKASAGDGVSVRAEFHGFSSVGNVYFTHRRRFAFKGLSFEGAKDVLQVVLRWIECSSTEDFEERKIWLRTTTGSTKKTLRTLRVISLTVFTRRNPVIFDDLRIGQVTQAILGTGDPETQLGDPSWVWRVWGRLALWVGWFLLLVT